MPWTGEKVNVNKLLFIIPLVYRVVVILKEEVLKFDFLQLFF